MEAIIAEANARNCEAWNTRDFEKMKELYTEDFQTMPAGSPMVKGIQGMTMYLFRSLLLCPVSPF